MARKAGSPNWDHRQRRAAPLFGRALKPLSPVLLQLLDHDDQYAVRLLSRVRKLARAARGG